MKFPQGSDYKIWFLSGYLHGPPVVHLGLRIFPQIFEKIRNGAILILLFQELWGRRLMKKNLKQKIP
jgi:hypothetical protein